MGAGAEQVINVAGDVSVTGVRSEDEAVGVSGRLRAQRKLGVEQEDEEDEEEEEEEGEAASLGASWKDGVSKEGVQLRRRGGEGVRGRGARGRGRPSGRMGAGVGGRGVRMKSWANAGGAEEVEAESSSTGGYFDRVGPVSVWVQCMCMCVQKCV